MAMVILFCGGVSTAKAELILAIGQNGSLLGSELVVTVGGTFELEFYVMQTGSSTQVSDLGVNNADIIITVPTGFNPTPEPLFEPGSGFELNEELSYFDENESNLYALVSSVSPDKTNFTPVFPSINLPGAVLLGSTTFKRAERFHGPSKFDHFTI